ncbi:MAG: type II secretion system F family protein [Gammaproteobacteria bacterium]|nr:MAG: type II secretion system F family protein [Gammaproteobacteria bacterium]
MPNFSYKALDNFGATETGVLIADNLNEAQEELKNRRLIPISVREARNNFNISLFKKISSSKLSLITRQLSTLINGGIPVDQALDSVSKQMDSPFIKGKLLNISNKVKSGFKLSESLEDHPESFDRLYCSLVRAGETSGDLGAVLEKTSDFLERKSKITQDIIGALVYPFVLFSIAIVVIVLLLSFVVPEVVSQFSSLNRDLPFITKALLFLSSVFTSYIFYSVLLLSGIAAFVSIRIIGYEKFKSKLDRFLLSTPIIKNSLIDSDLSRFTNSLSILRTSNISIINALEISAETISNSYLRQQIKSITNKVAEGETLAASLSKINAIPALVTQMIENGERSGRLEEMLEKVSTYLENKFQNSTKITMNLLEPLIVVFLGLFVALIVLAILLPLIQLNTLTIN